MTSGEPIESDVAIAGGGLIGMTLGLALAKAGLSVTVIERATLEASLSEAFDGRVSSFAPSSVRMLKALGLWAGLADVAEPILRIVVGDGDRASQASGAFLQFGDDACDGEPLAYMIENRHYRRAIFSAAQREPQFRLLASSCIVEVTAATTEMRMVTDLDASITASILVAAEGKESPLRERFGLKTIGWDYHQSAIVATIAHEHEHLGAASELFLPSGPFAILPMKGRRSSIVWTEPTVSASAFMSLDDNAFLTEVAQRFGTHLGRLGLQGPRWSYPLSLQMARNYVQPRFALVGDAAHVVHPLAGQGLNLGLRDAAELAEVLVDSARLGLDIGAFSVLERYETARRFDNFKFAATMEMFNRLFSNANPLLMGVRRVGLDLVNAIAPLKHAMIGQASEPGGAVPRLMRGLSL